MCCKTADKNLWIIQSQLSKSFFFDPMRRDANPVWNNLFVTASHCSCCAVSRAFSRGMFFGCLQSSKHAQLGLKSSPHLSNLCRSEVFRSSHLLPECPPGGGGLRPPQDMRVQLDSQAQPSESCHVTSGPTSRKSSTGVCSVTTAKPWLSPLVLKQLGTAGRLQLPGLWTSVSVCLSVRASQFYRVQ